MNTNSVSDVIILKDGLPIITINLDPQKGICKDQEKFTLVSGFLQAITSFADTIENLGEIDELQLTGLIFTFKKHKLHGTELLFVISADQSLKKSLRKVIIQEISSTFLHMFETELNQEWNGDIKPFERFIPVFKQEICNLQKSYEEDLGRWDPDRTIRISKNFDFFNNKEINKIKTVRNRIIPSHIEKREDSFQSPQNIEDFSPRFKQYQILQKHLYKESSQSSNSSKIKQIHKISPSLRKQFDIPEIPPQDSQTSNYSYYAPPVPTRNISNAENSIISTPHPQISNSSSLSQTRQQNFDDLLARKQNYMQINNKNRYTQFKDNLHHSVYDLCPKKRIIRAGDLHSKITNRWEQVLMVSLDGTKSIAEMASFLKLSSEEVLNMCQRLAQKGLIHFERE